MRRMILALPLLLAACAQGPTLSQQLSTFVGQNELQLVSSLGVPNRTYEVGGMQFLQYNQRSTIMMPGDPWGYGYYGFGRPWATPSSYVVVQCDITFALRSGRVESFTMRGDGCS